MSIAFEERLTQKREAYAKVFRLDDLNDANDRTNLEILLKTELMIDDLQKKIQELIDTDAVDNASNIKKLADLLRDATGTITTLQRTLAIDRRTRKEEETSSVADYVRALRRDAADFLDQRIVKTYCPDCRVMVGRIYPVHDHTAFNVSFECSQCHKMVRARRDQRDIFFDVKDANWRKKYKPEILQPKVASIPEFDNQDELVITAEEPVLDLAESPVITPTEDDLVLGDDEE